VETSLTLCIQATCFIACLNRIKQSRLFADKAETTLTRSRIYCLASILDRRERLFLPRIATAITPATTILQTLTPLQPVKAAEIAAAAEAEA
jgi:hypothetical protein